MPMELTNRQEVMRETAAKLEIRHADILRKMAYVGEEAVNVARDTSRKGTDYQDQTGNLRSSTGYILVEDGQPLKTSDFRPKAGNSGDGSEGSEKGRGYAESLAKDCPTGITLAVVAGMPYAAYVAAKGYDVLDSSKREARILANEVLNEPVWK